MCAVNVNSKVVILIAHYAAPVGSTRLQSLQPCGALTSFLAEGLWVFSVNIIIIMIRIIIVTFIILIVIKSKHTRG